MYKTSYLRQFVSSYQTCVFVQAIVAGWRRGWSALWTSSDRAPDLGRHKRAFRPVWRASERRHCRWDLPSFSIVPYYVDWQAHLISNFLLILFRFNCEDHCCERAWWGAKRPMEEYGVCETSRKTFREMIYRTNGRNGKSGQWGEGKKSKLVQLHCYEK